MAGLTEKFDFMSRYFTKETRLDEQDAINAIKQWAYPLKDKSDLQPLIERIGDARIVMLGEASHGTHEYYSWRTHITKRLIDEKGFNFIAVEGDWPDCYRLNRFIKGYGTDSKTAFKVLLEFKRWPTWMKPVHCIHCIMNLTGTSCRKHTRLGFSILN